MLQLTDVTRLNFFEVARAAFLPEARGTISSARRASPLTMVKLTRNLSEKFKAYLIIRHYVTAQSNVFCFIFITISTPISTKFFGQL